MTVDIPEAPREPLPPVPPAPPVLAPLTPSEEHTWAMLAHMSVLLNLVTGFLGPNGAGKSTTMRMLDASPGFTRFTLASFVFQWGLFFTVPLYSIYWVRVLHASDGWVGAIIGIIGACMPRRRQPDSCCRLFPT